MKQCIAILALMLSTLIYGQSTLVHHELVDVKFEDVSITVTADSAEEVRSSFAIEDLKEIYQDTEAGKDMSFKIICNGDTMSNGEKAKMSYAINGNSDDMEGFFKLVEKAKASAIKYYEINKG